MIQYLEGIKDRLKQYLLTEEKKALNEAIEILKKQECAKIHLSEKERTNG